MFGLRSTELLVILGIALLFFGPKHLPGLGKALGSAIRSFKSGMEGSESDGSTDAPTAARAPTKSGDHSSET